MPRVSHRSIEEIKARADIVEVVERHVRLKKAGRSYKGLSPFTNEKTPSFFVDPAKGAFYCFSTSQGGDVIRFIELTENLSFGEALEALAQRYNIALEYENGAAGPTREQRSLRRELLELHEYVAEYYHTQLMAENELSADVRTYWVEQRGFSLDVAKEFRIGFAPPQDDKFLPMLQKKGFGFDALRESGLFTFREGERDIRRFWPRFRGRLMIPICEPGQGQVVAFTARKLACTPEGGSGDAKYVNSPGTPLFHKSRIAFNLDRAQKAVRDDPRGFLMVEGQLDAIRCWVEGFQTAIAPQGTSVTDEQLHLLKRYSDHLHVVLDGDSAGQHAALRVLPMALAAGIEPRFVVLPAGNDPDSLLQQQGREALEKELAAAQGPMPFAVSALLPSGRNAGPRERSEAMKQLFAILVSVESEIARVEYLRDAASRMGIDFEAAKRDFSRFMLAKRDPVPSTTTDEKPPSRLTSVEADLLCLILQHEELAKRISEVVDDKWLDPQTLEGRLLGRLLWDLREGNCEGVKSFIDGLEDPEERNGAYALTIKANDMLVDDPQRDAEHLLKRLFIRFRDRRIEEIDRTLANAPEPGADFRALLTQRMELLRTKKVLPAIAL